MNVPQQTQIAVPPQQNILVPERQTTPMTNSAHTNPGPFDHLIKGIIHDRVSAYILHKVEKQIENLIDIDTNLCSSDINGYL